MTAGIIIRAYGRPIPQGSKRHVGGGRMVETSKHLRPWRATVKAAAQDATRYHITWACPVFARITFTLQRPAAHYGTGRNAQRLKADAPAYPSTRTGGDLDKLVRACLDALTDAKVWTDDSLVVDLRARKVYVDEHEQALDRPGVRIEIVPLADAEVRA